MLCGCSPSADSPAAPPEPMLRLDRAVAAGSLPDSVMELGWSDLSAVMGGISLADFSAGSAVAVFQPDVERRLPALDFIESVLGSLRATLPDSLPAVEWSATFAMVWPYSQSIVRTPDGNLFVALNHYLGEDYPGYSGTYPDYLVRLKRPAMLPVDVAESLIAGSYPYVAPADGSPTLMARMLHSGAVAYAMSRLLPADTPLSDLLGIAPDQLSRLQADEPALWRALMERQLIWSTDPGLADRLLRRAPSSPAIAPDAPGLAARFIGLQIVRSYVERHPSVPLSFLLSPSFYNSRQSLIDSQYAPR